MRIKKQYIGTTIYSKSRKIHLSEIVDESFMQMLKNEFPRFLEEDKPKKSKKKKVESDIKE